MNIKILRKQIKKTQDEVAKELNLQKQTYQNYELGKREPDLQTLKKIADYFNVSLDFLCDRPRPYDLPSTTTQEQKTLINKITDLNREQCMLVDAYIEGLKIGQQKQQETIKRLKGE